MSDTQFDEVFAGYGGAPKLEERAGEVTGEKGHPPKALTSMTADELYETVWRSRESDEVKRAAMKRLEELTAAEQRAEKLVETRKATIFEGTSKSLARQLVKELSEAYRSAGLTEESALMMARSDGFDVLETTYSRSSAESALRARIAEVSA